MPEEKGTLEEIEEKFSTEKESVESDFDKYVDKKIDEEIQERVRSALPWALALGAGLLVAYSVTRKNREVA
jgi:hypothetical protein